MHCVCPHAMEYLDVSKLDRKWRNKIRVEVKWLDSSVLIWNSSPKSDPNAPNSLSSQTSDRNSDKNRKIWSFSVFCFSFRSSECYVDVRTTLPNSWLSESTYTVKRLLWIVKQLRFLIYDNFHTENELNLTG